MELPLDSTDLSYDFCRPVTQAALREFDPDLRLVLSKRLDMFQLYRLKPRIQRHRVEGFGSLCLVVPTLIWEADVESHMGLAVEDNPHVLLRQLAENDTQDEDTLFVGSVRARDHRDKAAKIIAAQREAARARVHESYRHATADNMRLLMKAWEPFVNHPAFVR